MTPPEEERDDPLAHLLHTADRDAPPPDRAFLERLREQSTAAFAASSNQEPALAPNPVEIAKIPTSPSQRRVMTTRLIGALAAAAAALALLYAFFIQKPDKPNAKLAFGKALESVTEAKTVHLKVTRDGKTATELWSEKGGRTRVENGTEFVTLTDGELIWRLNEKTGKAERAKEPPITNPLQLVLAKENFKPFDPSKQTPDQETDDALTYFISVDGANGGIKLEAIVDAKSKQLRSVAASDQQRGVFAKLDVVNVNDNLPADRFAALNSLSEDGRVGKVVDTQGVVTVRPLNADRWTPVEANFVVMPGDWIRTDTRGANAASMKLLSRAGVIVGPGGLAEVEKSDVLKIHDGEMEISVPSGGSLELHGPDNQKVVVKGTQIYRVAKNQKLQIVDKAPQWLAGFKGALAAVNESLGSLIAKVDGRNVPLSVGYHKVTVDIRDQIARTVIEESFVNHTDGTLEGVFHFPLPQDASISGFGMWIGEQLVEADVVEKQRAREIYETILREKRDPGLLEWAGGNIFKARVFPIVPHSEKRIKITYTQVLPLRGSTYRYSYALQSELLQQHPLRELTLAVNVYSSTPLKKVSSPTHNTRDQMTKSSAKLEFTAKEYTPTKDFEVVVEQDARTSDIVFVPHRRGDDGYFMLQVMPPAFGDTRDVLPSGEPLHLLILADTSASIDRSQRLKQESFIAALLSTLTPKDTFNLAAFDVNCDWVFEKPIAAEPQNLMTARQMLEKRVSLGWTDLDKAFESAMKQSTANTHVVYIGDGIPTTRDADPVAFAQRLKRMYDGKSGTFHAIALGSSFESGVLKGIASLGGGSVRHISADQGPAAVALDLMREIAKPTLRDVKVTFTGLQTARVYPSELPNVPAGMQQIILGRYLPDATDQMGQVTVTGTLGGKPVQMSAPVGLIGDGKEESFIPRLWARQHLDALLAQGTSESIKDEIIALSEEYNIITPYTSFLVLETDADRERFGVKKRFRMRDGEKFFAKGRDNVNYELVQQQMKRAGLWRLNLRASVMRDIARLGRYPQSWNPNRGYNRNEFWSENGPVTKLASASSTTYGMHGGFGGGSFGGPPPGMGGNMGMSDAEGLAWGQRDFDMNGLGIALGDRSLSKDREKDSKGIEDEFELKQMADSADGKLRKSLEALDVGDDAGTINGPADYGIDRMERKAGINANHRGGELFFERLADEPTSGESVFGGFIPAGEPMGRLREFGESEKQLSPYWRGEHFGRIGYGYEWQNANSLLMNLFPSLPAVVGKEKAPKTTWPEPARKLAAALQRSAFLAKLPGGLDIRNTVESFRSPSQELSGRSHWRNLYSIKSWLNRSEGDGSQTIVTWCDGTDVGAMSRAFLLGRTRAVKPGDLNPHLSLAGGMITPLWSGYEGYEVTIAVVESEKGRVRLKLKHPKNANAEYVFLIDTDRNVLLEETTTIKGKISTRTAYSDFVEVSGAWWYGKIETFDDKGIVIGRTVQTVKSLADDAFAMEIKAEMALRQRVQFIREPGVKLVDAKKAAADSKASFDDHFTLLRHFAQIQQWAEVEKQFQALLKLAEGKAGMRWVGDAVMQMSRKFENLRLRYLAEADRLAKLPDPEQDADAFALAEHVAGNAPRFVQANEMLQLLDKLQPVYEKRPAYLHAKTNWMQNKANWLSSAGRRDEALALRKQLATENPRDENLQRMYADALTGRGDYPAAYAWLEKVLAGPNWQPNDEANLREAYLRYLQAQNRHADILAYLEAWLPREPERTTPYQMYLSTLIWLDNEEKANETIALWLKGGLVKDEMSPVAATKLHSAIMQALGQGYGMYTNRLEERWQGPLAEVARFHAESEKYGSYADMILQNQLFVGTDAARAIRGDLAKTLPTNIETMPLARIGSILNILMANDPAIPKATWEKTLEGLKKRWNAAEPANRNPLAQNILTILRSQFGAADVLAFLRLQMEKEPKEQRPELARQLFNELLNQPWTAAYEDEAFRLIGDLSENEDAAIRLRNVVAALHYLTDKVLASRYAALYAKVEHPEKLTKIELKAKQDALRKQSREEYSDRLAKEVAVPDWAQWVKMEQAYVDTLLERKAAEIAAFCWTILGDAPPKPFELEDDALEAARLPMLLRERAFGLLEYLATRKKAEPALVERLTRFIDAGIAQDGENATWREVKYRFLVALDKPKDLEKQLRSWVGLKDKEANRWRLSLGFVVAELGRLEEAVAQFEIIEKADELGPLAYRSLANWYMVLNKRDLHEKALLASYKMADEYQLRQRIYQKMNPWLQGQGHLPSELDPDVLRMFKVLFEKSAAPQNYLYDLQRFYEACRDFRLLQMLPDAVVGQTAGKVYPFLAAMSGVFFTIQDEAAVDSILEQMTSTRKIAKSSVDHRALDLLEVLTLRRAADLKNQPGFHGDRALAALKRAFEREWTAGEQRLMSDILGNLGHIPYEPLAKEQVRELEWLHSHQKKGSNDRLHVAHQWSIIRNGYNQNEAAIDLLTAALAEYRSANNGIMPFDANGPIGTLMMLLEQKTHHGIAEAYLKDLLKNPIHEEQRYSLTFMLFQVYTDAISRDAEVSLGSKAVLYDAYEKLLRASLDDKNPNYVQNVLGQLCGLYRLARDHHFDDWQADLRNFAFKGAAELLKRHPYYFDAFVNTIAQTLHELLGPKDGIAFLLDRIENEPTWLRLNGQDGWAKYSSSLAMWRIEAKEIGDLEPRLLKVVLKEIRLDLETRQPRNRIMYYRNYGYFWSEKEPDFMKVAEGIYAKRKAVGESVKYIARYMYDGLSETKRAIEILQIAFEQKKLDENGQSQLVQYLQEQGRHHEAIAMLVPMIERSPDNLDYRVRLMNGYFHTKQTEKLLATLKAADVYFHEKDRWSEGPLATLASACVGVELWNDAIKYYDELIPLHERTQPNRGVGNGTLSEYYASKATAYSHLGKTVEAVDAASGAIVAWGSQQRDRSRYLERLREVLAGAKDLDKYVAHLDKKEAEEKQGFPILRKALGNAYFSRNELPKAATQFQIAIDLQPEDAGTRTQLIACFDKLGDKSSAVHQVYEAAQLSRRNLALYSDMGNRYEVMERLADAERAYTSIVEIQAHESESHQLLAEIREKQDRWAEAVPQWEMVAKIRALEPTGLMGLAKAYIHQKQWEKASEAVATLEKTAWPARFNNVKFETHVLRVQVEQKK